MDISPILLSEIAVKIAQFCREPRHYEEIVDLVWQEIAKSDPEALLFADRIAMVSILEGFATEMFRIDFEGVIYLDDETMSLTDDELEEHRVSAVVQVMLTPSDNEE